MESISRLGMAVCAISAIVGSVEGVHGEKFRQDATGDLPTAGERLASLNNHESRKRAGDIFNKRELQTRSCNEQFAVVTKTEILEMIEMFLGLEMAPELVTSAITTINPALRYDIAAIKVCLSCNQIAEGDLETAFLSNGSPYGFPSYCSDSSYGYNAMHSALVFAPIDPATGQIVSGVLRGYVYGHDTEINVDEAPTNRWPNSLTDAMTQLDDDSFFYNVRNSISSALAASAGAVSISPDYIGYGESRTSDRVYLAQLGYKQAFAVSYLATKRFLSTQSNECTQLADVATVAGYGEGGYGALYGALALEQNGVEILSAHAGGTPWDLDTQVGFLLNGRAPEDIPESLRYIPAYTGYGYSNHFPFMANAGIVNAALIKRAYLGATGQSRNVQVWFGAPNPLDKVDLDNAIPPDQIDLFNANTVQAYTISNQFFNRMDACRFRTYAQAGNVPDFCNAVSENSLKENGLNDISFDVWVCHSEDDEVVTIEQIPDFSTNIKEYEIAPSGDHDTSAFVSCAMGPTFAIASAQADDPNSPVLISPLVMPPAQCVAPATTPPPTLGPTSASTLPPTLPPTVGTTPAPISASTSPPTAGPTLPPTGTETSPPTLPPTGTETPPPTLPPTETTTPPPTIPPTATDTVVVTGISDKCTHQMCECETDDGCDSGLICVTRVVQPTLLRFCSSQYVRARAKTSVGVSGRGGRAGRAKDVVTIGGGNGN